MSEPVGAGSPEFRTVALVLSAHLRDQLARHAETAYPDEACGALLGHADGSTSPIVTRAIPLSNSEPPGGDGYQISPAQLCELHPDGDAREGRLVGFYHSHPDRTPRPSRRDLQNGLPGLVYAAVSVRSGRAGARTAWLIDSSDQAATDSPAGEVACQS